MEDVKKKEREEKSPNGDMHELPSVEKRLGVGPLRKHSTNARGGWPKRRRRRLVIRASGPGTTQYCAVRESVRVTAQISLGIGASKLRTGSKRIKEAPKTKPVPLVPAIRAGEARFGAVWCAKLRHRR